MLLNVERREEREKRREEKFKMFFFHQLYKSNLLIYLTTYLILIVKLCNPKIIIVNYCQVWL